MCVADLSAGYPGHRWSRRVLVHERPGKYSGSHGMVVDHAEDDVDTPKLV